MATFTTIREFDSKPTEYKLEDGKEPGIVLRVTITTGNYILRVMRSKNTGLHSKIVSLVT